MFNQEEKRLPHFKDATYLKSFEKVVAVSKKRIKEAKEKRG